ncbi:MAG: BrnT family toxin [Candidatus Sulfotelmatobacter sp.]
MFLQFHGFDWDRGNRAKCQKHGLSIALIESLFARPLAIVPSAADSREESRFCAVGQTSSGRRVFLVFTLRRKGDKQLIRPISARYMHKKEIKSYEKENPSV